MGTLCLCFAELPFAQQDFYCSSWGLSIACDPHLCRVYKQVKQFPQWVAMHSPGSNFEFIAKVYQIANCHLNLVHTIRDPQLAPTKDYEVTLGQYERPAKPRPLWVMPSLFLKS